MLYVEKKAEFAATWYQAQNFWTGSKVTRQGKVGMPETTLVTEPYPWTLLHFHFVRQRDKYWKNPIMYNFRMMCLRILTKKDIVKFKEVNEKED